MCEGRVVLVALGEAPSPPGAEDGGEVAAVAFEVLGVWIAGGMRGVGGSVAERFVGWWGPVGDLVAAVELEGPSALILR